MKISYIKLYKEKSRNIFVSSFMVLLIVLSSAAGVLIGSRFNDSILVSEDLNKKEQVIIIDAGHGGEDCGAIGKNGVYEKDLNLIIANRVGEILENNGFQVIYTRKEDKLLYKPEENIKGIRKISDLKNRAKISEENPEALFVSIHMNSFGSERYSGLQVYYSEKNPESKKLAELVQNAVRTSVQPSNNRKTKGADGIYLLEHIESEAILIECGFLTNEEECKRLCEKEYQNNLSFAIVCGIIEYMEEKNYQED